MRFERQPRSRAELAPGQFFADGARGVYLACPACGGVEALSPEHVIAEGGQVAPAWKCPTATCAFFEFVVLAAAVS